jgi:DNA phosphorothioation-dependent restriction protein DptG
MALSKKQLIAMLSKDFESSNSDSAYSLKRQCDRLANFAYIAMKHLEDNNMQDFLLLKHDDLADWYRAQKAWMQKREAEQAARQRRAEIKERALARLTDEEKEALGLKKK